MNKKLLSCLFLLLPFTAAQAIENHQVGFKAGLTSIDNEDGWNFEHGSFFTDLTFDMKNYNTYLPIKPRIDLGYITIGEEDKGGVSSLLQFSVNGIYDVDLRRYGYTSPLTPYLLGGLGYEKVGDPTPVFESHPFMQGGFGIRYTISDTFKLVSEFKALQVFGGSDEDNEFQFMVGVDVPLFVEVIQAPLDTTVPVPTPEVKETRSLKEYQYKAPTPVVVKQNPMANAIVIPEEVDYVEDGKVSMPSEPTKTIVSSSVETEKVIKQAPTPTVKRKNLKVSFESSSAVIKQSSKAVIKSLANELKSSNRPITIEGYTDNSGSQAKNLELSKKRAKAVGALLIKYGVESSKIRTLGKGHLNPIADNDTEIGRAKNRRIEIVIH